MEKEKCEEKAKKEAGEGGRENGENSKVENLKKSVKAKTIYSKV